MEVGRDHPCPTAAGEAGCGCRDRQDMRGWALSPGWPVCPPPGTDDDGGDRMRVFFLWLKLAILY